jgi:hypothetical protein
MTGISTTKPMLRVAKPIAVSTTINVAHTSIGPGLLSSAPKLASIAVIASWLRSSISGTDTTLAAKAIVANTSPTPR